MVGRRLLLSAYCFVLSASVDVRAGELRDPFVFSPRAETGEAAGPALMGILWDATNPLAIIGEDTVAVGGRVMGWLVVEIRQDGVVLQLDGRREVITPGKAVPTP